LLQTSSHLPPNSFLQHLNLSNNRAHDKGYATARQTHIAAIAILTAAALPRRCDLFSAGCLWTTTFKWLGGVFWLSTTSCTFSWRTTSEWIRGIMLPVLRQHVMLRHLLALRQTPSTDIRASVGPRLSIITHPKLRSYSVVHPKLRSYSVVHPKLRSYSVVHPKLRSYSVEHPKLRSYCVIHPKLRSYCVVLQLQQLERGHRQSSSKAED
jgi:hypothetical protein